MHKAAGGVGKKADAGAGFAKKTALLAAEKALDDWRCPGLLALTHPFAILAKGAAVIAKGVTVVAKGIVLIAESFAAIAEGFTIVAKGFALIAEGFALIAEGFAVVAFPFSAGTGQEYASAGRSEGG